MKHAKSPLIAFLFLLSIGIFFTGCQATVKTTTTTTTAPNTKTSTSTDSTATPASTSTSTSTSTDTATKVSGLDGEDIPADKNDSKAPTGDLSEAEKKLDAWKGGKLSPAKFLELFGPIARATMLKMGVPASVILAQAALETGWGSSTIKDAKNLFGIKGTGPAGTVSVPTREYGKNGYYSTTAKFRKYNSWQESMEDHSKLLSTAGRYKKAMAVKNDPKQFAREIHKAGYATDPQYSNKLIKLMDSYDMYKYNK